MAKRARTPDDYDSPWKEALHGYLPFFLAYFFPDIHADIDWTRGYVALDKEFQRIVRRSKAGKCIADKLFKVWLNNGAERWLIVHVEVQGDYEKEFPERMYEYHVAARRLYNQKVVSLAVLCDENANWRPRTFEYDSWGCGVVFTFRIAKLLDWPKDLAALEVDPNPFAAVVAGHLQAQLTCNDPVARKRSKLRLVKGLYRRGFSPDDVRCLFRLLDWLLALPDELEDEFWQEMDEFETEENMEYITSVERIGMRKGLEKGLEKGLLESIALDLQANFGPAGTKLLRKARGLDIAGLRKLLRLLKKAKTLDEVRDFFNA